MCLIPIAICYRHSHASLAITALEGAGFSVFAPGFHTVSILPHHALALEGYRICVPISQARDAIALLHAIEDRAVMALDPPADAGEDNDAATAPPAPDIIGRIHRAVLWAAFHFFAYFIGSVSSPIAGIAIPKLDPDQRETQDDTTPPKSMAVD